MDPYKILGVSQDASEEEIKKAYKKLAMQFHPDRNPGDKQAEEKFKEISSAYEAVKDGKWNPQSGIPFDFNEMFSNFGFGFDMGNPFGKKQSRRPSKRTGKIQVTLEEAFSGCEKKIKVGNNSPCEKCSGTGVELDSDACSLCNGVGQIRTSHGALFMSRTCNGCNGFGRKIKSHCLDCGGSGKKTDNTDFTINIPAGVRHGQKISPASDLEIIIIYAPHSEFILLDNMVDIMSKVRISMFDALLGGSVKVKTLSGFKSLKINPSTQSGTIYRIEKGGMANRGNHLVEINVEILNNLTEEQKELVIKLKETVNKEDI